MTRKIPIVQSVLLVLVLFAFFALSGQTALAKSWQVIDINTSNYQWIADPEEGVYHTTVTLTVGDTFTNILDSSLEEDTDTPPEILTDYGDIIEATEDDTYKVVSAGTATKTYISAGENGWTKKIIQIHAKVKENDVEALSTSFSKLTMTTKETKQLQVTIKALAGLDKIKLTNSNSSVLSIVEQPSKRIRNENGQTIYYYKITPHKAGSATIKINSVKDPSFTKTITITVKSTGSRKPIYYVSSSNGKYSYSAMVSDLTSMAKFHQIDKPVSLYKIGPSLDKRNIYCMRIGNPNAKKRIFYVAGIHGREYINPYFVMDNIEEMLNHYDTKYSKKSFTYRQLYNSVCLYVIPMMNPDGITIAQQGPNAIRNTTLRANVKKFKSKLGISYSRWKGNVRNVDLNRNYPSGWEKLSTYRKEGSSGSKAGSEPETKCMMDYINKIKPTALISYHSMGENFYWGYAISKSSTCYKQAVAMKKICSRLTGYYATPCHSSYKDAVGCLEDWLAYKKKIPSLCVETGNVRCPLPFSQYKRIYSKNQYVVESVCDYFR